MALHKPQRFAVCASCGAARESRDKHCSLCGDHGPTRKIDLAPEAVRWSCVIAPDSVANQLPIAVLRGAHDLADGMTTARAGVKLAAGFSGWQGAPRCVACGESLQLSARNATRLTCACGLSLDGAAIPLMADPVGYPFVVARVERALARDAAGAPYRESARPVSLWWLAFHGPSIARLRRERGIRPDRRSQSLLGDFAAELGDELGSLPLAEQAAAYYSLFLFFVLVGLCIIGLALWFATHAG